MLQKGGGTLSKNSLLQKSAVQNASTQKKKLNFGLNVGSSSIIVIFVILCLVSFATLSIVSANADKKLTAKVLERTTAYYNACNEAEEALAGVDATLIDVYKNSSNAEEYFDTVGHKKSYSIIISDLQILQVNIDILYPNSDEDTFYRIANWQVVNTGDLQDDGIVIFE